MDHGRTSTMPSLDESFAGMLTALAERYGPPPAAPTSHDCGTFPAILEAGLSRIKGGRKVDAALDGLRQDGLLEPPALAEADPLEITESVRAAGAVLPPPAVRLIRRLAAWLVEHHQSEVESLGEVPTSRLRDELRELNGIGPASADAILLEGLGRPAYPVDRASYRVWVRHGWIDPTADYDEARESLESQAPDEPETLARLSAWLERVGRDACRSGVARCERCPLQPFLPPTGPIDPEGS